MAVAALLVLTLTGSPGRAEDGVAAPLDAARVFVEATAAGDAARLAALYAPDALFLLPGAPPLGGRPAIRAVYERNFAQGRNAIVFRSVRGDTGADRAVIFWEWTAEVTAAGAAPGRTAGRSLVSFRKFGDRWQIIADMMQLVSTP